MKHGIWFMVLGAVTVMAVGMATTAFTQAGLAGGDQGAVPPGGPGGNPGRQMQMRMPPVPPTMKVVADSLFVLQGLTLTKYHANTLEQTGVVTLTVKTPAPGNPPAGTTEKTMAAPQATEATKTANDTQAPPPPPFAQALLLSADDKDDPALLVVIGNSFQRIRVKDLAITATADLPAPVQNGKDAKTVQRTGNGAPDATTRDTGDAIPNGVPGGAQGGPGGMPGGMHGMPGGSMPGGMNLPIYELANNKLYLLRGPQLLAINVSTGEVTTKQLQQANTPQAPTMK